MYEIRFHGMGGEGVVTLSEMIGKTATQCGKWAHSFPFFGTEVRGAPVKAFTRVSDSPISIKSYIYEPDIIVITNDTLLGMEGVTAGLKKGGALLINTTKSGDVLGEFTHAHVYPIRATELAFKLFGRPIVNTILFGALIGVADLFPLEAAGEIITEQFKGRNPELNTRALSKGYEEIRKVI